MNNYSVVASDTIYIHHPLPVESFIPIHSLSFYILFVSSTSEPERKKKRCWQYSTSRCLTRLRNSAAPAAAGVHPRTRRRYSRNSTPSTPTPPFPPPSASAPPSPASPPTPTTSPSKGTTLIQSHIPLTANQESHLQHKLIQSQDSN